MPSRNPRRRRRGRRRRWLRFGLGAVLVVLAVLRWPIIPVPPASAALASTQLDEDELEEQGRELYFRDCSGCHGPLADGTFRGPGLLDVGTASVHFMVATGRMPITSPEDPIMRGEVFYEPEEIAAIIAYLDSLIDGPPIPEVDLEAGRLAEGGATYRLLCAGCHGAAGTGGAMAQVDPAPALSRATPVEIAEAVITGPTAMPEFGADVLTDEELASVVRYVVYLQDPPAPGGLGLWHVGPVIEGLVAMTIGFGLLLGAVRVIGGRRWGSR